MDHIKGRLEHYRSAKKDRRTERGELMKYFITKLNATRTDGKFPQITMGRMGKILEQIPTKDLYYLKAVCDRANSFSKKFWFELDPEKHLENRTDKPF